MEDKYNTLFGLLILQVKFISQFESFLLTSNLDHYSTTLKKHGTGISYSGRHLSYLNCDALQCGSL